MLSPYHSILYRWYNAKTPERGKYRTGRKLDHATVREIKRRLAAGEMQITIAEYFEISRGAVNKIAVGKTHADV